MRYCMAISINGALRRSDSDLDGIISSPDGYELNARSVRMVLKEHAEKGYKVYTGCDNIDDEGYCLGHEEESGEKCEVCGKVVPGFKYKYCCNSFDCGCGGKPVEPCICSEQCWNELMR